MLEGLESAVKAALRSLPPAGGDIVITIREKEAIVHSPVSQYVRRLRRRLPPGDTVSDIAG